MAITNKVPLLKPTRSYKIPATEGPTKAPREKADDQSPESTPNVVMSSAKPASLKKKKITLQMIFSKDKMV